MQTIKKVKGNKGISHFLLISLFHFAFFYKFKVQKRHVSFSSLVKLIYKFEGLDEFQ